MHSPTDPQPHFSAEGAIEEHSFTPDENVSLDAVIFNHVRHVLDLNQGNKLRTARQLGISRSTLYRILRHGPVL
jgi:ActR/RegA family two-component response regulator